MAKGNHSFTEQDIRKRFGAIVGHTVAEVDAAEALVEYPVLRVLGHRRLHGRGCRAGIAATRCATAFGTTAGPAVHRVADKVELVADGTGDLRSREYHHQTDDGRDQYVLDD